MSSVTTTSTTPKQQQQQLQQPQTRNSLFKDFRIGLSNAAYPILYHIFDKYILVAIGSIIILIALYGINEVIKLTTIEFPASVCLMLLMFVGLSIHSWWFDEDSTQKYFLKFFDIPCGFALRWMNIYFTPPFVTLVLADKVSVKEAFIIAAVFTVGYIFSFGFMAYFVWILQILLGTYDHDKPVAASNTSDDIEKSAAVDKPSTAESTSPSSNNSLSDSASDSHSEILSVTAEDYDEGYALQQIATNHELSRAVTRATERHPDTGVSIKLIPQQSNNRLDQIISIHHHHDKAESNATADSSEPEHETITLAKARAERITDWFIKWFDFLIYGLVFIIGIPIYFTTGYELLFQLGTAVLLFRSCMLLSAQLRRFLHPILISFSLSLLVFYIFSLIKGQNFFTSIRHYKTGKTYLHLFDSENYSRWPGAGDFLLSLMDVSIVSLSLAMYNYRGDLKRSFLSLLPPIIVATFMSFFIYPPLCYHIGISAARSLGFTGRSVTMALGTPLVTALDGSVQLMAVTTIMSGILGVLCGDFIIFKMFRVRKADFVSRGVSMGVTCGAVSTAHLLTVDSRAAAMSSLSFTLFGTFMVIMSAITPLVKILQGWVGM